MPKLFAGVLSLAFILHTSPCGVRAFATNSVPTLRHSFSSASCPGAPSRKQYARIRKNPTPVFCQSGGIASGTDAGKVLFSERSSVSDTLVEVREITVTDPQGGQSAIRAMWFENSPGVWQSAMRMVPGGNAGEGLVPDASQLLFHSARGLALAPTLIDRGEDELCLAESVAVIGLGGGSLPSWLQSELPSLQHLLVSELDATVCKAAAALFGFDASRPGVSLQVGDGVECLRDLKAGGKSFDVLVLDAGESAAVCAGGVLAINCIVDSEAALLDLLRPLQRHFPDIAYLDNTDVSHAWLRTPQTRVALLFKPLPSSSAPSRAARPTLLKAAKRFGHLLPSAQEMEMEQRVAKEWSDFPKLERIDRFLAPSPISSLPLPPLPSKPPFGAPLRARSPSCFKLTPAGKQWRVSQQKLWAKTHQGLAETPMLPREEEEAGPQSPEQLKVYRRNHPGVARLQSEDGSSSEGGAAEGARAEEGAAAAAKKWGQTESVEWTEERRQQLRTFAAQHAGVDKLQDLSAEVEPSQGKEDAK